jgi:hypothetical protein
MPIVKDNELTIRFTKKFNNKNKEIGYTIDYFSGENKVYSKDYEKPLESDKNRILKNVFSISFNWNKQLAKEVQQEAIDSLSKGNLLQRTKGDRNYLIKKLINIDVGNGSVRGDIIQGQDKYASAVNRSLDIIQAPFNLSKPGNTTTSDLETYFDRLKDFISYSENIQSKGGTVTPMQQIFINMNKNIPKNIFLEKEIDIVKKGMKRSGTVAQYFPAFADKKASQTIVDKFAQLVDSIPSSKEVREIINSVKKNKTLYNQLGKELKSSGIKKSTNKLLSARRKEARNTPLELYRQFNDAGVLTNEDKKKIAYWAATSNDANLSHNIQFKDTDFVYRYDELINADSEIARAYRTAYEALGKD